jgi:hypothetical protein
MLLPALASQHKTHAKHLPNLYNMKIKNNAKIPARPMAMLDLLASLVPVYCTGLVEVEDGEEPVLLPFEGEVSTCQAGCIGAMNDD